MKNERQLKAKGYMKIDRTNKKSFIRDITTITIWGVRHPIKVRKFVYGGILAGWRLIELKDAEADGDFLKCKKCIEDIKRVERMYCDYFQAKDAVIGFDDNGDPVVFVKM